MSLAAIKEEYKEKILALGGEGKRPVATIGHKNFVVEYEGATLTLSLIGVVMENHLGITVETSQSSSSVGQFEGGRDKTIQNIYHAMIDYWKVYAQERKRDGVIVIGNKEMDSSFKFDGNIEKSERKLLDFVATRVNDRKAEFKGAYVTSRLDERLKNTLVVIRVLEEVMEKEKVLTIADETYNDLHHLFGREIPFFYLGEEMQIGIKFPDTERGLRIVIITGGRRKFLEPTTSAVLNHLKGMENDTAIANLLENPMDNYLQFLQEAARKYYPFTKWLDDEPGDKEEMRRREFDKLGMELGDWKTVEEEFADLRKGKLTDIFDWADKKTIKRLSIISGETLHNTFYFVFFQGVDSDECFIKVANNKRDEFDLKQLITDLLMEGVIK